MLCQLLRRAKGLQVTRIIEVDTSTAQPVSGPPGNEGGPAYAQPSAPAGDFVDATVKWFNSNKGYGFVSQVEHEQDVFIHMVILRRSGLTRLQAGQDVQVRISEGPKGPQATEIRLI